MFSCCYSSSDANVANPRSFETNVASIPRLRPPLCLKPLPFPDKIVLGKQSRIRHLPRRGSPTPLSPSPNQPPNSHLESGHSSTPQSSPHTRTHRSASLTTHRQRTLTPWVPCLCSFLDIFLARQAPCTWRRGLWRVVFCLTRTSLPLLVPTLLACWLEGNVVLCPHSHFDQCKVDDMYFPCRPYFWISHYVRHALAQTSLLSNKAQPSVTMESSKIDDFLKDMVFVVKRQTRMIIGENLL